MSRFYLILFMCLAFEAFTLGQNNLSKKYIDFADQQYEKRDYYYALEYYRKALEIDSNSIDLLWKYAETFRAYRDYRKAEYYYAKVYEHEKSKLYPYSLLYWGLMQKQNGKYDEAIATFEEATKVYNKNKQDYLHQKSSQEYSSTLWAKSAVVDTLAGNFQPLPDEINSENSELGHGIFGGQLLFSSLRADSISTSEEVYATSYKTALYTSKMEGDDFQASERIEQLFIEKMSTGNGAFSLDSSRFYFSLCDDESYNYRCKIMVASYSDGNWDYIDSLGSIINVPGTNTTMPCIAELDGEETLIFAADRDGSNGGLDLYSSAIKDGNQYGEVRALNSLNSPDNDITPWWDAKHQQLFFASSWHNGFGGYDIFHSTYDGAFQPPVNSGIPVNSPANDLYYFKDADTSYITSNRLGVRYSKNPTCCSDIFSLKPPKVELPPSKEPPLPDLFNLPPVTLYFHNDIPNPRNNDSTTSVNYIDSYYDYTAMQDQYKEEYAKGLNEQRAESAREDIATFFTDYVDKGVSDLVLFRDLLLEELNKGTKINVTVKGFASPLAKTAYNVNLTKRRIASLVNYMREYDHGVFSDYLDGTAENGGKVVFSQVPFGEYAANQLTSDNPKDVQNSVYSRAAAIERKIEIQSVSYLEEEEFALASPYPIIDVGVIKKGTLIKKEFVVRNQSEEPITLDQIRIPCECTIAESDFETLQPEASGRVTMTINTETIEGFFIKSIYLRISGEEQELRLYISGQTE